MIHYITKAEQERLNELKGNMVGMAIELDKGFMSDRTKKQISAILDSWCRSVELRYELFTISGINHVDVIILGEDYEQVSFVVTTDEWVRYYRHGGPKPETVIVT